MLGTLQVHDMSKQPPNRHGKSSTTGVNRTMVFYSGEGQAETRKNIKIAFQRCRMEEYARYYRRIVLLGDLKFKHTLCGSQMLAIFGCLYCTGSRIHPTTGQPCGNGIAGSRWLDGFIKTWEDLLRLHDYFEALKRQIGEKAARKYLSTDSIFNQEHAPIFIPPDPKEPVQDTCPIESLHTIVLGVNSNAVDSLEKLDKDKMDEFYNDNNLRKEKGKQPGGKFSGPQFKRIWRKIPDLERRFNDNPGALALLDFMKHCEILNKMVNSVEFDSENYIKIIEEFRNSFNYCQRLGLLQETEKAHHLLSPIHLEKVLTDTQESLWAASAQGLEGKHRNYRIHQVFIINFNSQDKVIEAQMFLATLTNMEIHNTRTCRASDRGACSCDQHMSLYRQTLSHTDRICTSSCH